MGNCIEGSNPFLSAKKLMLPEKGAFFVLKRGKLFSLADKIKKDRVKILRITFF
jgi:hypothetical protein